ncbi:hypothetical protein ACEWY4_018589 [Coilia grayii]|uniref:Uncharacterized protein n=1 Tax=Coilia grayii TaxID=363190 RepID=A0ABD1JEV1_9TELE
MPITKVIKPKTTEIKPKTVEVNVRTKTLESPLARRSTGINKKRASSCTRCNASFGHHKNDSVKPTTPNGHVLKCEKKGKPCVASSKPRDTHVKYEPTITKADQKVIQEIQSHRAFTVIPPNPKKRSEIQKKAEAELAALEDLRLSRAMGYISLAPSSVGGCLTLEEVRKKQQQELQTRRKKRQVGKCAATDIVVLGTSQS